jgi:hypothetical protein
MNRGAQDVGRKLDAAGYGARARLARDQDVSRDYVSHWLAGRQRPNTRNRLRIKAKLGTPIEFWDIDVRAKGAA